MELHTHNERNLPPHTLNFFSSISYASPMELWTHNKQTLPPPTHNFSGIISCLSLQQTLPSLPSYSSFPLLDILRTFMPHTHVTLPSRIETVSYMYNRHPVSCIALTTPSLTKGIRSPFCQSCFCRKQRARLQKPGT